MQHLTCSRDIGYLLYRASTILFQILFEYEFIKKLPRESFLPWQYDYDLSPNNKLSRVNCINPEYLYLVRLTPRKDLYNLIVPEHLPAFWYFVKQHFISRKNRIIPTLELVLNFYSFSYQKYKFYVEILLESGYLAVVLV